MTATISTAPDPSPRRALLTLCGVETWERFSFYGMQGILLLYLYYSVARGGLGISQATAVGLVGAYGSVVYLSTIAGAWIADRVAGQERTLFASAVLIMLGHISLAMLPGTTGLAIGLGAVATGSGGLKANTTALLGALYRDDAAGRESGFALFYLGVNVGSLLGPLLTGVLAQRWGFHVGFGVAAVGMALGLVQYVRGRRRFAARFAAAPNPLSRRGRIGFAALTGLLALAVAAAIASGLISAANLNDIILWIVVGAVIALFALLLRSPRVTAPERRRVVGFIPMFVASTAFWALSQQQFTVLTVYADKQLNRSLFGWQMPVSWVQTINPIFIVLLSGVFAALWTRLGSRQPSSASKFGLSNVVMGIAFLAFVPLAGTAAHSVPLLPVVGILFLFSVAELLLAPVGLAFASVIAPDGYRSRLIALFYLSIALGTSLSGVLSGLYSIADQVSYFSLLGAGSIAVGATLLCLSGRIGASAPATAPALAGAA